MKKRGLFILTLFLVLFSFSVNSQTNDLQGVNICNVPHNCDPVNSDGICPEDFTAGRVCAIQDKDCAKCIINKAVWSAKDTSSTEIFEVKSGEPVYMYVETTGCNGKDAMFTIEGVKFLSSKILSLQLPASKVQNSKVAKEITFVYNEEHLTSEDKKEIFNKYKFTVNINPTDESETLEITKGDIKGQGLIDKSCSDGDDNDLDGCVDNEDPDCGTEGINTEDSDFGASANCPAAQNGACSGWKCSPGECTDGFRQSNCPPVPVGCPLPQPPSSVKCYQRSEAFPFFSNFNATIVIFLLAAYYEYRIYKKKK